LQKAFERQSLGRSPEENSQEPGTEGPKNQQKGLGFPGFDCGSTEIALAPGVS
jgi:hypothetical protein